MAKSSFGELFTVTTAGESHGPTEVAIVDGCPPGLPLSEADFEPDMARRRPGQSQIVTQRREPDVVRILSGVFEGVTTGTAIALSVENADAKSKDYENLRGLFRPGHADFSYQAKYGVRDHRGGGRASARETVMRVAAGVIAKKILASAHGTRITAYTKQVGDVVADVPDPTAVTLEAVEATPVRCPDPTAAPRMIEAIEAAKKDRDSIGGVCEIVCTGVPAGWGEPVFDKLGADLGKALFSIPAVVGVERGSGFEAARMRGSVHDDRFTTDDHRPASSQRRTTTAASSAASPPACRSSFARRLKPASSIPQPLDTVTTNGAPTTVTTTGRHDPCLVAALCPRGRSDGRPRARRPLPPPPRASSVDLRRLFAWTERDRRLRAKRGRPRAPAHRAASHFTRPQRAPRRFLSRRASRFALPRPVRWEGLQGATGAAISHGLLFARLATLPQSLSFQAKLLQRAPARVVWYVVFGAGQSRGVP